MVLSAWLVFILVAAVAFQNEISAIIAFRQMNDVSAESRGESNLWAVNEFLSGNFFGVGWGVNYYTDNTFSYLLVASGLPGVISYVVAWIIFYRSLYLVSAQKTLVIANAIIFFASSFLVATVESHPGSLILFVLYWNLCSSSCSGMYNLYEIRARLLGNGYRPR